MRVHEVTYRSFCGVGFIICVYCLCYGHVARKTPWWTAASRSSDMFPPRHLWIKHAAVVFWMKEDHACTTSHVKTQNVSSKSLLPLPKRDDHDLITICCFFLGSNLKRPRLSVCLSPVNSPNIQQLSVAFISVLTINVSYDCCLMVQKVSTESQWRAGCVIWILTSRGLPWTQISSWYHRRAFSRIHRWTRRFLSPFRSGGLRERTEPGDSWGSPRLSHAGGRAVVHFCISPRVSLFLSVSRPRPMHAAKGKAQKKRSVLPRLLRLD